MNADVISLVVFVLVAAAVALTIVFVSSMLGRGVVPEARRIVYECGLDQASGIRRRFPVKFFLTAVLFIIFDVEIVLLFPWAVAFRKGIAEGLGSFLLLEIALFLVLLGLALLYAWGSGALKWEE